VPTASHACSRGLNCTRAYHNAEYPHFLSGHNWPRLKRTYDRQQIGSKLPILHEKQVKLRPIGFSFNVRQALWPRLTGLKWLHSASVGLEHLLFSELVSSSVVVTNAKASANPSKLAGSARCAAWSQPRSPGG
jgi:phosphoglycerate dehydrogenase-like enzyme